MDYLLLIVFLIAFSIAHIAFAQPNLAIVQAAPPLMLAQTLTAVTHPGSFLISEKLDGVRAYWDGHNLYTRSGHLIHAPHWFVEHFPRQPLDGELWAGRGKFEFASGLIRSNSGEDSDWQQMTYQVFDLPNSPLIFEQRYEQLKSLLASLDSKWIQVVMQHNLASEADLSHELDSVIANGGEGLMLHRRTALYEPNRSPHLLKLKRHQDAEAIVIGYIAGKGKYQGMTGSLKVRNDDGREFRIGSGLTDDLRQQPPAIGTRITYRYDGFTKTGLPRFARFLRIRPND
ncbi:MAG: DNA ligase [Oceanobacter sp.]